MDFGAWVQILSLLFTTLSELLTLAESQLPVSETAMTIGPNSRGYFGDGPRNRIKYLECCAKHLINAQQITAIIALWRQILTCRKTCKT